MEKICKQCLEIFQRPKHCHSHKHWEEQKYCSVKCRDIARYPTARDPVARAKELLARGVVAGNGCIEWIGSKLPFGYGSVSFLGKIQRVHRMIYHHLVAPIPNGLLVLHQCDNPSCINPNHLFVGTDYDNNMDCIKKGRRRPRGKRPITEQEKEIIKLAKAGILYREIAKEINRSTDFVKHVAIRNGIRRNARPGAVSARIEGVRLAP